MSSTNRGAARRKDDAYYTPDWCVRRLMEVWNPYGDRWLEPSAGAGNIIRAAKPFTQGAHWTAVELDPEVVAWLGPLADVLLVGDFLDMAPGMARSSLPPYDVVIGNPPYSLAMEFVQACLQLGEHVALLLRLNFVGSAKRSDFLRRQMPDIYVLPNRPSFTGGKTDSIEYAWFVWGPHRSHLGRIQVLKTTPKAER